MLFDGCFVGIFENEKETDYISLTDMTVGFNEGSGLIGKWITNKNTLEYLGVWEKVNNLLKKLERKRVIFLGLKTGNVISSFRHYTESSSLDLENK